MLRLLPRTLQLQLHHAVSATVADRKINIFHPGAEKWEFSRIRVAGVQHCSTADVWVWMHLSWLRQMSRHCSTAALPPAAARTCACRHSLSPLKGVETADLLHMWIIYNRLSIDCILEFYNNSMQILVSNHNPMIFHKSVPPYPKSVLRPPTPEIVVSTYIDC